MNNGRDGFAGGASSRPALPAGRDNTAPHADSSYPVTDQWHRWWTYAQDMAYTLLHAPNTPAHMLDVYGPVLNPDENALIAAPAECSRLVGGSGHYQPFPLIAVGRPGMMLATAAASIAVNAYRKAAVEADAHLRWQAAESCQVIVTDQRLLCHTPANGWASFYYGAISEFQPDLSAWMLTLAFDGRCAPLRIAGPPVPALALWVGVAVEGRRWSSDPRLLPLLR